MRPSKALNIVRATAAVALLVGAAGVAEAGPIAARQQRQQLRIAHGVASGALTRREAARLELRHLALGRDIARMRASGGCLGPRERAVIRLRQDALSRGIWRQKHDAQRRR